MSKRNIIIVGSLAVGVILVITLIVFLTTREKTIPISQVPQNVITVLDEKLPGGEVLSVVVDEEGGKTIYEITKNINGVKQEISIDADGIVIPEEISEEESEEKESVEKAGEGQETAETAEESGEEKEGKEAAEEETEQQWLDSFGIENRTLSSTGRNKYFILEPGYQLILEGKEGNDKVILTITVLNETKKIGSVETRVVEEKDVVNGVIEEVSRNFFAIDKNTGDIFYFGEDVDIYKDGKVVNHEGAWIAGTANAKAGLLIPGIVYPGARYYQEMAPGVAMDRAEIISIKETIATPAGTFNNCLKTQESSALESGEKEYKIYAPGIGLVKEETLLLTKYGVIK